MTTFGKGMQVLRVAAGIFWGVTASLAVISALAPVTGHAESDKVEVCHLSGGANDTYLAPGLAGVTPPALWVFGQLMDVNENAVDAHLAHGDSATKHPVPFQALLGGTYWTTEELLTLLNFGNAWSNVFDQGQFPNADCGIRYPIIP